MENAKNMLSEQNENMQKLKAEVPEAMEGFMKLVAGAEADGALPKKTKVLIALGIAVKAQCHWCIALHAKKLLAMNVSKEEIMEAGMMAVVMGGGPAMTYMNQLRKCIEELSY